VALTVANGGSNDDTTLGTTAPDWITLVDSGSPNGPNGISWTVANGGLGFNPNSAGVQGTDRLTLSMRINPTGAGNNVGFPESVGLFEIRFLDSSFGNQIRYQFNVDSSLLSTVTDAGGATGTTRPFTTFTATTDMANPTSGTFSGTTTYANWRLVSLDNPAGTNGTPGGSYNMQFNNLEFSAVPEPSSMMLVGSLMGVAAYIKRRRKFRSSK
jgi:hypothetical protein